MAFLIFLILLICSALISGAEVAFFSLHNHNDAADGNKSYPKLEELLENPKKLLATILVSNNFINIAIVILSAYLMNDLIPMGGSELQSFFIQLFTITFVLLLFGEVLPKIYASRRPRLFIKVVLPGIYGLYKMMLPLSKSLVHSIKMFGDRAKPTSISVDDLSQALELAGGDERTEENRLLVDIVKFGSTSTKQIMTPRVDITSVDVAWDFHKIMEIISDSGYSRLPVYDNSLDTIKGILYIKDLLPHIHQDASFVWQNLIRTAFFVPENKKIDDLLQEFRNRRVHLAIVVDEFGGTSGLITLEDIIEEVVGEINDEFDLEEIVYSKIDERNYVFEGKTPLHEFLRILDVDQSEDFELAKGDSDTLAGFLIEISGELPRLQQKHQFANMTFTVESMDKRRIKRIKVQINEEAAPGD